jgi:hypothetical protein
MTERLLSLGIFWRRIEASPQVPAKAAHCSIGRMNKVEVVVV